MRSDRSKLWNPFEGYTVCVSNPWKIAEYKRILGVDFDFERRLVTPSGANSRNNFSPSIYMRKMPTVVELLPKSTAKLQSLESKGQYEELGQIVASKKALWAYQIARKPVIVEAVHLFVPGLSGFPGHLTEEMEGNNATLVRMVNNTTVYNRRDNQAVAIATLVALTGVQDGEPVGVQVRHGVVSGCIVMPERAGVGFGWDEIFVPNGSPDGRTFQQLGALKNQFSMRKMVIECLRECPFVPPNPYR